MQPADEGRGVRLELAAGELAELLDLAAWGVHARYEAEAAAARRDLSLDGLARAQAALEARSALLARLRALAAAGD